MFAQDAQQTQDTLGEVTLTERSSGQVARGALIRPPSPEDQGGESSPIWSAEVTLKSQFYGPMSIAFKPLNNSEYRTPIWGSIGLPLPPFNQPLQDMVNASQALISDGCLGLFIEGLDYRLSPLYHSTPSVTLTPQNTLPFITACALDRERVEVDAVDHQRWRIAFEVWSRALGLTSTHPLLHSSPIDQVTREARDEVLKESDLQLGLSLMNAWRSVADRLSLKSSWRLSLWISDLISRDHSSDSERSEVERSWIQEALERLGDALSEAMIEDALHRRGRPRATQAQYTLIDEETLAVAAHLPCALADLSEAISSGGQQSERCHRRATGIAPLIYYPSTELKLDTPPLIYIHAQGVSDALQSLSISRLETDGEWVALTDLDPRPHTARVHPLSDVQITTQELTLGLEAVDLVGRRRRVEVTYILTPPTGRRAEGLLIGGFNAVRLSATSATSLGEAEDVSHSTVELMAESEGRFSLDLTDPEEEMRVTMSVESRSQARPELWSPIGLRWTPLLETDQLSASLSSSQRTFIISTLSDLSLYAPTSPQQAQRALTTFFSPPSPIKERPILGQPPTWISRVPPLLWFSFSFMDIDEVETEIPTDSPAQPRPSSLVHALSRADAVGAHLRAWACLHGRALLSDRRPLDIHYEDREAWFNRAITAPLDEISTSQMIDPTWGEETLTGCLLSALWIAEDPRWVSGVTRAMSAWGESSTPRLNISFTDDGSYDPELRRWVVDEGSLILTLSAPVGLSAVTVVEEVSGDGIEALEGESDDDSSPCFWTHPGVVDTLDRAHELIDTAERPTWFPRESTPPKGTLLIRVDDRAPMKRWVWSADAPRDESEHETGRGSEAGSHRPLTRPLPCRVRLRADLSPLPEGAHQLNITARNWVDEHAEYTLSLWVDRAPPQLSLVGIEGLTALPYGEGEEEGAEGEFEGVVGARRWITHVPPLRPFELEIQTDEWARCQLKSAPDLPNEYGVILEPFTLTELNARLSPTEARRFSSSPPSPFPQAPFDKVWRLEGISPPREGQLDVYLECHDLLNHRRSIPLQLLMIPSPPRLSSPELSQLNALHFDVDRHPLLSEEVSWPIPIGSPIFDPLTLLDRSDEEGLDEDPMVTRWWGWWAEAPCEERDEEECALARNPLSLTMNVDDLRWPAGGLSFELKVWVTEDDALIAIDTNTDRSDLLNTLRASPPLLSLTDSFDPQGRALIDLSHALEEVEWSPPSPTSSRSALIECVALSPNGQLSVARELFTLSALTPPPRVEWVPDQSALTGELWSGGEFAHIDDLSLGRARLSNPHPYPIKVRLYPPEWLSLSAELAERDSAFSFAPSLLSESCLFDEISSWDSDAFLIDGALIDGQIEGGRCLERTRLIQPQWGWSVRLPDLAEPITLDPHTFVELSIPTPQWGWPTQVKATLDGPQPESIFEDFNDPLSAPLHEAYGYYYRVDPLCDICLSGVLYGVPYVQLQRLEIEGVGEDGEAGWRIGVSPVLTEDLTDSDDLSMIERTEGRPLELPIHMPWSYHR